jgi:hypothetical protein
MEPARIEIVLALSVACIVMASSFVIARHADLNTVADPSVLPLIRHAYAGLLFQFIAVFILAACLLPKHIQEKHLYATQPPNRLVVYFLVLWSLLIMLGVRSDASRALRPTTVSSADATLFEPILADPRSASTRQQGWSNS